MVVRAKLKTDFDAVQNTDAAEIATGLMAKDNPLMKQARTTGRQIGAQRGLSNSSMAAGAATNEMLKVAAPMAENQASRGHQQNMAVLDFDRSAALQKADMLEARKATSKNQRYQAGQTAKNQRYEAGEAAKSRAQSTQQALTSGLSNAQSLRQNTITNINANTKMSREDRQAAIDYAENTYAKNVRVLENIYDVDIKW